MVDYTQIFKVEIVKGIIDLFKKIWLPISLAYILYFIISKAIGAFFVQKLGYNNVEELANEYMLLVNDLEALLEWFEDIKAVILKPETLTILGIAVVIQFIVMCWVNFFGYKLVEPIVKNESTNYTDLLKESVGFRLFGFIGIMIASIVLMIASFAFVGVIGGLISPFLSLLLFPVAVVLNLRLWLAFPIYSLNNTAMGESFELSFHYITWSRAAKILGIGFVFLIGLVIVEAILGMIVSLFGTQTTIGFILSNLTGFASGAFMYSVMIAAYSALYYRYFEIESEDLSIEDHLVDV